MHAARPRSGRRAAGWRSWARRCSGSTTARAPTSSSGMTHEEIFTTLAIELSSYRQLPQFWYQFQTKFRDEPRPKSGLMRVREFTMKDSYSFDIDEAGLDVSFEAHRGAYERIFARLGIPAIGVEASSGNMGGSDSVEFMCPSDAGEDLVARCGARLRLRRQPGEGDLALPPVEDGAGPAAPERLATPGVRTIDDLASQYGIPADRQIKTLVYVIDGQLTLVLLRGDHPLAEQKLVDATGAVDVRPAQPDEIRDALGASARQPRRGRRHRPAGHRRPGAARQAGHGHRGEHRRRAPDRRGRRARTSRSAAGPTCARSRDGRAVPALRHAAGDHPGDRGRAHLQARPQVHHHAGRDRARPGRRRRSSRSWAATASAWSGRWRPSPRCTTTTPGLAWPVQVAPAEVTVVLLTPQDEAARGGGRGAVRRAAGRRRGHADRRPGRAAGREVQGRGADRHPVPGQRRPAATWPTASSRSPAGRPARRSGCRWPRRSGTCATAWPGQYRASGSVPALASGGLPRPPGAPPRRSAGARACARGQERPRTAADGKPRPAARAGCSAATTPLVVARQRCPALVVAGHGPLP